MIEVFSRDFAIIQQDKTRPIMTRFKRTELLCSCAEPSLLRKSLQMRRGRVQLQAQRVRLRSGLQNYMHSSSFEITSILIKHRSPFSCTHSRRSPSYSQITFVIGIVKQSNSSLADWPNWIGSRIARSENYWDFWGSRIAYLKTSNTTDPRIKPTSQSDICRRSWNKRYCRVSCIVLVRNQPNYEHEYSQCHDLYLHRITLGSVFCAPKHLSLVARRRRAHATAKYAVNSCHART